MTKEEKMAVMAVEEFTKKKAVIKDSPEGKDLDAWIKAGKPAVLYKMDQIEDVYLYGDCGYGHIFLIHDGKVLSTAVNFVTADIEGYTYIGLSEYFGDRVAGLYKGEVKC